MPNQDGSGPQRQGSKTGRGMGNCGPIETEQEQGRGQGRGRGRRQGNGNGYGKSWCENPMGPQGGGRGQGRP